MDDTAKFCPLSVMPLYDNQQKHSPKQLFWIKEPLQRYSQFVSFQMSNQHFHKMELSMCGVLCLGHTSCCLKIEYNFLFHGSNLFNNYKFFVNCTLFVQSLKLGCTPFFTILCIFLVILSPLSGDSKLCQVDKGDQLAQWYLEQKNYPA